MTKKYLFDKRIFRGAILILILIFFLGWALVDFKTSMVYVHCPADGPNCYNPLYSDYPTVGAEEPLIYLQSLETVPPGFTYGTKPNFILSNPLQITVIMVLLAFVLNHIIHNKTYKFKRGFLK